MEAVGLAILHYMRDFPSESLETWEIVAIGHEEPLLDDHRPAYFTTDHNAWVAKLLDVTADDVLNIYQSNPTIQRLVREILDDPDLPHYGEISPTGPPEYIHPPLYSPPRRTASQASSPRTPPRPTSWRPTSTGVEPRTPPRATTSSRSGPGSPPRRRPRAQRNQRPVINRRTPPPRYPEADDEYRVSKSSRSRIAPAKEVSDTPDDATEDEDFSGFEDEGSDLQDLPDADLVEPFTPIEDQEFVSGDSDSDNWEFMYETARSDSDDGEVEAVSINTPVSRTIPAQQASVDANDWLAPANRLSSIRPDLASIPNTPDWASQAKAYQQSRSASMSAENERRKSVIHAQRSSKSPTTPIFGPQVEYAFTESEPPSGSDIPSETEAEFEGFVYRKGELEKAKKDAEKAAVKHWKEALKSRKAVKHVQAKKTAAAAKKSEEAAATFKANAVRSGHSKPQSPSWIKSRAPIKKAKKPVKKATPPTTPSGQGVRKPSTPGGPARRTRSKAKAKAAKK